MRKPTAAQQRLFDNASIIAATRLIFDKLSEYYSPKKLSDVVTIFNGQSLKKVERQDDGDFNVYGSGGLVGRYSDFLSSNPFVVIGRKGSAGKPTYAPYGGWVIDTAYYAQPNDPNELMTRYLYYAISSLNFTDDIISTAIPGINRTAIYKHTISIPPSDIQQKIIEFLAATEAKTVLPEIPAPLDKIRHTVEHIEALAERVREAQRLRREAVDEADALWHSSLNDAFQKAEHLSSSNKLDAISIPSPIMANG